MSFRESNAQVPLGACMPRAAPFASLTFSLPKQRVAFAAPFASITAHHQLHHKFGDAQQEPATGIEYPAECCVLTKKICPQLAGVGVRAKRILGLKNINVYSVGMYVDAHGAKKALHKYKGEDVDELMGNQKLFDELVGDTHFERSLRLVISFGSLKRSQFLNALEERLKPELAKAKEAESTMKAFEGLFDGVNFRRGTEIAFSTHHKGQLVTQIDGKQVGSIQSPALVKALFDIYVGPDPVSADAKKSIGKGLVALMNE
uniref:Chalcone isomerase domain-containing protein n=1 Tax=Tetradesmus obliquus TaxID=3088 RepID=A0A383W2M2_TETOB|eukprot:jgi/Sobl393_1/497/SZX71284.1